VEFLIFRARLLTALQHGFAGGYYLTFLLAGFITAAARQARTLIRPFFAPAEGQKPTVWKRVYDIVTIVVSAMTLNYAASPFIIQGAKESVVTWRLLGWYGHIWIFGSLAFFYLGGAKFLRGLQKSKGIAPPSRPRPVQTPSSTSSGKATPVDEKNFTVPPSVDKIVPPLS